VAEALRAWAASRDLVDHDPSRDLRGRLENGSGPWQGEDRGPKRNEC
jgi:hypothetical protein